MAVSSEVLESETVLSFRMDFSKNRISFQTPLPKINNKDRHWTRKGKTVLDKRIAGIDGKLSRIEYLSADGSLSLVCELWQGNGDIVLRYIVRNLTKSDFELQSIRVVDCQKLKIGTGKQKDYRAFLDQASPMDGIPSGVRIGQFDETYATAVCGAYWDRADLDKVLKQKPCAIPFSNFCIMDNGSEKSPFLTLGFVAFDHHFNDMKIATAKTRTTLTELSADAVFNCVLPAGVERATSYFLMSCTENLNAAQTKYDEYAARISNVMKMPGKQPPAVGCTWHFYGSNICEKTVLDEINAIQKRNVPLDVYLIDDFWEPYYGDWNAIPELFPNGMKSVADAIRAKGLRPGIWTAPFASKPQSQNSRDNDFFFKNEAGERVKFFGDYMLDPTAPGALEWLSELYSRLHKDYGYEYFKLDKVDFCNVCWRNENAVCHDRTVTLVEAYRRMLTAVRNAVGPESFICICGGHFGASIGLCDTQRSSGDTYGRWQYDSKAGIVPIEEFRFKQTVTRLHWRRIWYTNADGMEIRKRAEPQCKEKDFGLSIGLMTDGEAEFSAVKHYLTGGILMCGESLVDIDDARLSLYRHVIPSVNARTTVADPFTPWAPMMYVTHILPKCETLEPWNTLCLMNYKNEVHTFDFELGGEVVRELPGKRFLLFELLRGEFLGSFCLGNKVSVPSVPPHRARIVKIIPVDGISKDDAVLLGTDLHYSGGGVEIAKWTQKADSVTVTLNTKWTQYPVKIHAFYQGKVICSTVPARRKKHAFPFKNN